MAQILRVQWSEDVDADIEEVLYSWTQHCLVLSLIILYLYATLQRSQSTALYENRKYNCLSLKKTILFFSRTNCLKVCVRYFRWSIWMSAFPLQHISNQYRTIIGRYFETVWGLKVSNPFKKRLYQQYSAYSLYENLRKQMQFKLF